MTPMRNAATAAALLAALGAAASLAGCSRELTTICDAEGDYLTARTAEPLRVPDGLTVPDQSEALLVPELPAAPTKISGCLDAPPLYSDAPGAIAPGEPSRRERRRERRAARDAEQATEAAEAPER